MNVRPLLVKPAKPALATPAPAKSGTWPRLSSPVDWEETNIRSRAQSYLCGIAFKDGSSQCPPLTLAEAKDVLKWSENSRG